jgi:hypothetical protein
MSQNIPLRFEDAAHNLSITLSLYLIFKKAQKYRATH